MARFCGKNKLKQPDEDVEIDIEWITTDIYETKNIKPKSSEKNQKISKMFLNEKISKIKETRSPLMSAIRLNLKKDDLRHRNTTQTTQISKPNDLQLIQQLSFTSIGTFNSDQINGPSPITIFQLNTLLQTPKTFEELLRNSLFKVRKKIKI